MSKNRFLCYLIVITLVLSFAGCGSNDESVTQGTTNTTQESTFETSTYEESVSISLDPEDLSFTEFDSLTAEQQQTVFDSFDSPEDFFVWHDQIKQEYDDIMNGTATLPRPSGGENSDETAGTDPTDTTQNAPPKDEVTFMDYHSMSYEEQVAFVNSFASYEDFFAWHRAAKKAYDDTMIEIDGTGSIDLGDIIGGD